MSSFSVPISEDSGECLKNMMKWGEIIHHGKIIKDVESSWSGIFIIYDDGSVDTFYLGGSPLVLRRKK